MRRDAHDRAKLIYQLKVRLRGLARPVWRQILVPGGIRLDQLHLVIQAAMGWENRYGYAFRISGVDYCNEEIATEVGDRDASQVRLADVATRAGMRFSYEYDFGDSWVHTIVVESMAQPETHHLYPSVIAGARACPPEDCGGPEGYKELLTALRYRAHPEHEASLTWVGGRLDRDTFDLSVAGDRLHTALTYAFGTPEEVGLSA